MKPFLAMVLAGVLASCAETANHVHRLDGKVAVVEGRWNALAKEEGQIICLSQPRVVDVVDVGHRPTPRHEELIRVTALLHWRGMTKEEIKWTEEHAAQGVPNAYIIRWSEAEWKTLGPPDDGDYRRLFENAVRKLDSEKETEPSKAPLRAPASGTQAAGQEARQP
jgi:hypothetical protein